jgi:hypothetical protein
MLGSAEARAFLQVNTHNGITYFNKEAFEVLVSRLFLVDLVRGGAAPDQRQKVLLDAFYCAENLLRAMDGSNYEFEKLVGGIKSF